LLPLFSTASFFAASRLRVKNMYSTFEKKQIPLIYLLLTAAVIIAFWQVNQCDFISYDDRDYITGNAHIQGGITPEAIGWAFTAGYAANWHPLTWMSHMLDVQLFGLNPHRHHLVNLLFHVLNTLLLFFVFNRMTKAPWKSAFVAALFGLHPLHVESVAWVAERKDVLSTFFWMLTMAAYVRYAEHGGREAGSREQEAGREKHGARGREGGEERAEIGKFLSLFSSFRFPSPVFSYLAALIFFALGLMSKPMLVTLPFVLLLLDYWPLGRMQGEGSTQQEAGRAKNRSGEQVAGSAKREPAPSSVNKRGKSGKKRAEQGIVKEEKSADGKSRWELVRPLLLEKTPFFALAALSCIVTIVTQQKGGAVQSFEVFSLGVRVANALVSYIEYIAKTIWPNNLAVLYPHPGLPPLWQVFGAVMLLAAVTMTVIRMAGRFPCVAMGWLWFTGTLVPVIGIVQVGAQAMADRYTYIPLIGLFVIAAWGMPELLAKWRYRKEALLASSPLVLSCLVIVTWTQVGYWRTSISLYDHALKVTSRNHITYYNRAEVYQGLGNLRQAISDYDRTIEIYPKYADAYNNRGIAYRKLGNISQAISDYNKAIEVDPGNALAFYNLGFAYGMLGNYRQAIEDYSRAIEADPGIAESYYNRGLAYGQLGDYRKAIESYDTAVEINKEYASAYNNRGLAHWKLGERTQAIEDYRTAARLNNENAKNFLTSQGIRW
jgi:tetratricopeptide (TPR) repeat protein